MWHTCAPSVLSPPTLHFEDVRTGKKTKASHTATIHEKCSDEACKALFG